METREVGLKQFLTTPIEPSVCYLLYIVHPLLSHVGFVGFLVQCELWTNLPAQGSSAHLGTTLSQGARSAFMLPGLTKSMPHGSEILGGGHFSH